MNDWKNEAEKYLNKKNEHEIINQNHQEDDVQTNQFDINSSKDIIVPDTQGTGLIGKMKLKSTATKANIEKAKVIVEAQLEIIRNKVTVAKDLEKKRLDLICEEETQKMEMAYNNLINDLGLKHKEEKMKTVKHLILQTNQQIKDAVELGDDVLEELKQQYIDAIRNSHNELFEKISSELGSKFE